MVLKKIYTGVEHVITWKVDKKNENVASAVVQSKPTNGMTMSCSTFTMFFHRHRYSRITRQEDYWIKTVSFLTCIVT